MRSTIKLINIMTYAQFKEIILKRHKELLHPVIEKLSIFKEKFYYPDHQKLILNIINVKYVTLPLQ